eukprot:6724044-Karenia_brevis.AAC.1
MPEDWRERLKCLMSLADMFVHAGYEVAPGEDGGVPPPPPRPTPVDSIKQPPPPHHGTPWD